MSIRTRFAPSPTGYLHIGGVRTALFNWILARQSGGQFILRIDDTDAKRNVAEALQPILDGFRWLGIDWDEGPTDDGTGSKGPHGSYFQSERLEKYQAAAAQLIEQGFAYKDYAGPDFQAEREAAEKAKQQFVYSRKWMAETPEQAAQFESEGRSFVVRLKMPREGVCAFTDHVRGDVSFDWALEPDHVIQRADGTCLYHLANVVDDHDFEITHVIRAVEHLQYLNNKDFKRLYQSGANIAEQIGIEPDPATFNPVLVDFYRDIGFDPAAINNYLLLLGWSLDDKTESFSREQMIELFSLDRVIKAPASFDAKKLTAFQQNYMDATESKTKVSSCLKFLQAAGLVATPAPCDIAGYVDQIVAAAGDRICMAGDILAFDFFFVDDDNMVIEDKPFQKRVVKPESAGFLLNERRRLHSPHVGSQLGWVLRSTVDRHGRCDSRVTRSGQW